MARPTKKQRDQLEPISTNLPSTLVEEIKSMAEGDRRTTSQMLRIIVEAGIEVVRPQFRRAA